MKMKKTLKILLVVILIISAFWLGLGMGQSKSKLSLIQSMIENNFPLEYDEDYVEDMAAKFMVMALDDPYSSYFDKNEGPYFLEELEGAYKGIGITIAYNYETDEALVDEVLPDTPAHKAGVLPGDILLSVDGKEVTYESYDSLIYYIKGIGDEAPDDKTEMEFEFKRNSETYKTKMKRAVFTAAPVEMEKIEDERYSDIAYIKLSEFSTESAKEFSQVMENIKDEKGIILDLRDNGGGSVTSLLDIAELILPEGTLFYSEDAKGKRTYYEIEDNEYNDLPLVLLVNENTASASEVLTSAVKDKERGLVIGTTTYGKGLVQGIITFRDGSLLKLTVEKYYTSKGEYINEIGITPDIIIEDSDEQLKRALEEIKKG